MADSGYYEVPQSLLDFWGRQGDESARQFDDTLSNSKSIAKGNNQTSIKTHQIDANASTSNAKTAASTSLETAKLSREAQLEIARNALAEDQRQFNLKFPEANRQFDTTFGEGQRQFNESLGEKGREFNSTFGEGQRQFDVGQGNNTRDFGEGVRRYDQDFGEKQREYDLGHNLAERQFGGDLLKTGASMRGALDYFQGAGYARGVQNAGLSPYVAALRDGGSPSIGGGTGTDGNPIPLTLGTMANTLAGGASAGGSSAPGATTLNSLQSAGNTDAYGRPTLDPYASAQLASINGVYQKGLAHLGLGALESLTPDELASFKSAGDYLGRNTNDELAFYQRSRPGQGSAMAA